MSLLVTSNEAIIECSQSPRLAASFTTVVNSFVTGILMPPLSVIFPLNKNMEEQFYVLKSGDHYPEHGYNTIVQAQEDGAVVLAWGYVASPESLFMLMFMLSDFGR